MRKNINPVVKNTYLAAGLLIVAGVLLTASADSFGAGIKDAELGAKTWISRGQTDWNHNANNPFLGNPTSELTYENVDSVMFEINGKVTLNNFFFFRGNLGVGSNRDGDLIDDDYLSQEFADFLGGPTRFSRTQSSIDGADNFYTTLDIGKNVATFDDGRGAFGLFAGAQYWREKYKAYGVNVLEDQYDIYGGTGQLIPASTLAISNKVEWISARVGVNVDHRHHNGKLRLSGDLALIPYADMHNEDSHHLREDLAPGANIIMDGDGYGAALDVTLSL